MTEKPSRLDRLSPRQQECLRLVYDRQATSKEIAALLGISKTTVDGYIAEAVELLGARDRREAARVAFADSPRAESGGDAAGVTLPAVITAEVAPLTEELPTSRPWRSQHRQRNELTLAQTVGWIALIALGSLMALALAASIGAGLPSVWRPVLQGFRQLTQ